MNEQQRMKRVESFSRMLYVETVMLSMNRTMQTNESMQCSIVEHSLIRLVHCVRMQAAARAPTSEGTDVQKVRRQPPALTELTTDRCKLWIRSRAACDPNHSHVLCRDAPCAHNSSLNFQPEVWASEHWTNDVRANYPEHFFFAEVVVVPLRVCT